MVKMAKTLFIFSSSLRRRFFRGLQSDDVFRQCRREEKGKKKNFRSNTKVDGRGENAGRRGIIGLCLCAYNAVRSRNSSFRLRVIINSVFFLLLSVYSSLSRIEKRATMCVVRTCVCCAGNLHMKTKEMLRPSGPNTLRPSRDWRVTLTK